MQIGDKVESTGVGRFKKGYQGKIESIEMNGKFLRYNVKWNDSDARVTGEREKDISLSIK